MASTPTFTKTIGSQITSLSNTNLTTVLTADATYARRITGISVTSDDTSAQTITLYISDAVTDMPVGAVSVAIGAGTVAGTLETGLIATFTTVFRERDATGLTILNLPATYLIKARLTALTGGKTFYVLVKYEKYD